MIFCEFFKIFGIFNILRLLNREKKYWLVAKFLYFQIKITVCETLRYCISGPKISFVKIFDFLEAELYTNVLEGRLKLSVLKLVSAFFLAFNSTLIKVSTSSILFNKALGGSALFSSPTLQKYLAFSSLK
jgi:hypothetical protein